MATAAARRPAATGRSKEAAKAGIGVPSPVRKAISEVLAARKAGKGAIWHEVLACGHLHDACKAAGLKYLQVAKTYLQEEGSETLSPSRISGMVNTYKYLREMKVNRVPANLTAFPTYSQVLPLAKFVREPEWARARERGWEKLHKAVFHPDPKKRPSVARIKATMAELSRSRTGRRCSGSSESGIPLEKVTKSNLETWFKALSYRGRLLIQPIRPAKLSLDAVETAIRANWKEVKAANLIKIEVLTDETARSA